MKAFTKIFIPLLAAVAVFSCKEKTSTGTQSSVAQITAFAFAANDSFPGLGNAVFVVEQLSDTGLIRMRQNDSIQYGTPLDSVIPSITYYTTPSSVTFYIAGTSYTLTGYDTLNLSKKPIYIRVVAQNTDYYKWYKLDFDVHTMDGDLFKWDTVCTTIPNANAHGTQKALVRKDRFYYYQNDGYGIKLFTSDNEGKDWTQQTGLNGLPTSCNVRQIVEGDSYFFYGKDHDFYYSPNGIDWSTIYVDTLNIVALYTCMKVNNVHDKSDSVRLWLAARNAYNDTLFYTVKKDQLERARCEGLPGSKLPSSFPVEDYTTVPFQSSSLHEHALIAGGFDGNGNMTNARWSLEYNYISNTYHLTNLAEGDPSFPPFAGSSASYYGKYLYLLGGRHEDGSLFNNTYSSTDEGVHWVEVTDTLNSKRPKDLKGRNHTNTFVHNLNLYIIGGEDHSTTYSDVYRGRMNSIAWPEIGN